MLKEYREAKEEGRPIVVKGIIQKADTKNQNGRVYPFEVLREKVDKYKSELIDNMCSFGELDHTEKPVVEFKNVSHMLKEVWWEGKDVFGAVELLDTPAGKIAQEVVLKGYPIGISSRAVGSIKNEGFGHESADVVGEDLEFICWDLVCHPSTPGSYLKMYEARDLGDFDLEKTRPTQAKIFNSLKEILKG